MPRGFRGGFYAVNVVDTSFTPDPRYTQLPSYELNKRRPCLDGSPEDGPTKLRKPRIDEGVSFCEPIKSDFQDW